MESGYPVSSLDPSVWLVFTLVAVAVKLWVRVQLAWACARSLQSRTKRYKHTPYSVRTTVAPATPRDVQMTDAPDLVPSRLERASQYYAETLAPTVNAATQYYTENLAPTVNATSKYYADNLAPMVNATLNVAARGIKRAAETTIVPLVAAAFTAYNEIKHTDHDGLVVKRFKRLPFADDKKTSLAELTNTLPVSALRNLPASHFCWTIDPLAHLGRQNHINFRKFLEDFMRKMHDGCFVQCSDIDYILIPSALPASVAASIEKDNSPAYMTVFLHNYLLLCHEKDDSKDYQNNFRASGNKLIGLMSQLVSFHKQLYDDGGRIPVYKACHVKPLGPIEFPYDTRDLCQERVILRESMSLIAFMLESRCNFNQTFPVATFAGVLADLDAIRADQPPPSYIDWPGKFERLVPGAWPEHDMEEKLFDTIKFADYTIDTLWDTKHPSPKKKVTAADQRTPIRMAMRKNKLIKNRKGQMQPFKGALKKVETDYKTIEKRCELEMIDEAEIRLDIDMPNAHVVREGRVNFIDGPVAFYMPSTNTPLRQPAPHSRKFTELREITELAIARGPDDTEDEDTDGEDSRKPSSAVPDNAAFDALLDAAPSVSVALRRRQIGPKLPIEMPSETKTADELLEEEGPLGRPLYLKISQDKLDEMDVQLQLNTDFEFQTEQQEALEKRIAKEERERVAAELLKAELKALREADARATQTGKLREPHKDLIPDLSEDWVRRACDTLRARHNTELAKLPDGTPVMRKDFEKVVPQKEWLNDEIVNGTLSHLTNYVNQSAGIKEVRTQTPKCQMFNSFVATTILKNKPLTDRTLRKAGIKQENFCDVETILVPMCVNAHWTLIVIRPKHRQFAHLDSLQLGGQEYVKESTLRFIQTVLGDDFNRDEWSDMSERSGVQSPLQPNSCDCGVHTITNGICMGLAIDPTHAYDTKKINVQRLRVASVILNGGFTEDLTLDWI